MGHRRRIKWSREFLQDADVDTYARRPRPDARRARIGQYHKLQPMRAMTFTMGTHSRLGGGCVYVEIPGELVQRVIEACTIWPEGRTGSLAGWCGYSGVV